VISYGREYSGADIDGGLTAKAGMEQPIYFWTPDIAPSGLMFYTGRLFPAWRGNIFIGALAGKHLVRLVMKNGRVAAEEQLLPGRCVRFRDVRQGPDGAIYILTDQDNGQVLRLTP
jgi:glucose/arabinose dehydrogenase